MSNGPQFINKNGKKEFVVLPYQDYIHLQERLDDLEDLLELRKAKRESKGEPTYSLDEIESTHQQQS